MDLSKVRKLLQAALVCSSTDPYQQGKTIDNEMHMFKSSVCRDLLSVEELEKTEMEIIRFSQKKNLAEELISLRKEGVVKQNSSLRE